jgi:hypothetical protein
MIKGFSFNTNMPVNFVFPISFSENTTKNNGEYRKKKNKIVLSEYKSKTY